MEILFSILAGVFAIIASVLGVKNRVRNSKSGTRSDVRNSREGLDDFISKLEQLEQLESRADDSIKRVNEVSSRIRKREPETNITE
jgi:hypothetical protein